MEQVSIFKFYKFGELIQELLLMDANTRAIDVYNRLTNFNDFLEELKLRTTQSASKVARIDSLHKRLDKQIDDRKDNNEEINEKDLSEVKSALNRIKLTLEAEVLNKYAYLLQEKRYSNEILTKNIFNLIERSDLFIEVIPAIIQFHLKECGLCLAFDRNTAATFHVLRATEEFIRFFNCELLDVEYETSEIKSFFDLIKETEELYSESGFPHAEELITSLHMVRKNYRNQSQHSDRIFGPSEALDLLNLCIRIINLAFVNLEYEDD